VDFYKAADYTMGEPYTGPIPKPTPETKPYWDGAKRHVLRIQRCDDCATHFFYPRPMCPSCLSRNVRWIDTAGTGRLHTYVINHRPPRKFPLPPPIVIGIVELTEGPRVLTQIVDVTPDPAHIQCDMPVEVVFDDITDEITLPKFRPRESP
jgi:uncharacterized OB-fold protein